MITIIITTKSGQKISLNFHATEGAEAVGEMCRYSDWLSTGDDEDGAPMIDRKRGLSHVVIHYSNIESLMIEG